jgi:1-acyl-sn-glycerol-3-phosphate acyltransferase
MVFLRSLIYNLIFFLWTVIMGVSLLPFLLGPRRYTSYGMSIWGRGGVYLLWAICGIRFEIRGRENFQPDAKVIFASKHQSAWETMFFMGFLHRPAIVMKQALLLNPMLGPHIIKSRQLVVKREDGGKALKKLLGDAREAAKAGRPVVIFPEGTRTRPGDYKPYPRGVAAIRAHVNLPVVPVAMNSGLFWRRNAFMKRPGTIVVEFLPPLGTEVSKNEFMPRLEEAIETASNRLMREGGYVGEFAYPPQAQTAA